MIFTSRSEWKAEHGIGALLRGAQPRVVIHHSYRPALDLSFSSGMERDAVKGIERFHVENNGWVGIGYNWLVAPTGRVYEGRGWGRQGAHAGPVNDESVGICLLINGSVQEPGHLIAWTVRGIIRKGLELGYIDPGYVVSGHRDHMDRTCPGDLVYGKLQGFRHDVKDMSPNLAIPGSPGDLTPHASSTSLPKPGRVEVPQQPPVSSIHRVESPLKTLLLKVLE